MAGSSVSDGEQDRTSGVLTHGAHQVPTPPSAPAAGEHAAPGEHEDQPHEKPEDWGWHGEMGKVGRGAGWVVVAILLVMNLGNQTRHNENFWLVGVAAFLVLLLLLDRRRRKNSWRG